MIKNVSYGLLFTLTFFITIFSLTVLSKNFVIKVFKDNDYYSFISDAINDNPYGEKVTFADIKKDINKYIRSRYRNDYYKLPGNKDSREFRDYYNAHIKFLSHYDIDFHSLVYMIFIVALILIIITGSLLNKTKKTHNLKIIISTNFYLGVIIFGLIKVFFNSSSPIINSLIKEFLAFYLASIIIPFLFVIYSQIKTKLQ